MADQMLLERSPLAAAAAAGRLGRLDGDAGVVLRALTGRSLTLLIARKGRSAEAARLAAAAGLDLPRGPKLVVGNGVSAIWAGPEQWMVVAEPRGRAQAERLVAACAPVCMTVDQSDARALVSIAGRQARAVLSKGVGIDLHPRAFKTGDTALTPVAGMGAHLWQVDDEPRYEIAVARSYAESFWHWLTDAAAEYGATVSG